VIAQLQAAPDLPDDELRRQLNRILGPTCGVSVFPIQPANPRSLAIVHQDDAWFGMNGTRTVVESYKPGSPGEAAPR